MRKSVKLNRLCGAACLALLGTAIGLSGLAAHGEAIPAGASYDAETRPHTAPAAPGTDQLGGGGGAQTTLEQPAGAYPPGYGYAPRSSVTDYPAAEVQTVPMARAQEAGARWRLRQIQTDLYRTVDFLREDFEYSPELRAASDEEKSAYGTYLNAKEQVFKRLQQDTTYRTMLSLSADLKKQIEDHRAPSDRPPTREEMERLMATASLRLSYGSSASAMEAAALEADSTVQDARKKLVTAGDRVASMRVAFNRKIRRDPQFASARKAFDEAELNYVVASAFRESATEAANVALEFAYYLHNWDAYDNHNGYAYGAGYPYGGGYGGGYYNTAYSGFGVRYGYTPRQSR